MDYCLNCNAELGDPIDYQEDPEVFGRMSQSWLYQCPKCGKKFWFTKYYAVMTSEIEEVEE